MKKDLCRKLFDNQGGPRKPVCLQRMAKFIVCSLSYDELKNNDLLTTETDGLLGMLRATEGVEIALLF